MDDQESALSLPRLLRALQRSWILVVALALGGATVAYLVSDAQMPVFKASASVYFSLSQGTTSADLNQGSAYTQAQMLSFATLATSSITLDGVIDDLGLDTTPLRLSRNIEASIPQNTVILNITASSASPKRAAEVANSVASNLSATVAELSPTTPDANAAVSARVIEPAVEPTVQSSPSKSRDTLLGGILGLVAGAVIAVLFALFDTRVRSAESLSSVTTTPVLGQVGRFQSSNDPRPVIIREPNGIEAEWLRRVRAGLRFASIDKDVRIIAITSGVPSEGKTTLSVELALAAAEGGSRVLLVDADLRRPRVAEWLGLDGSIGLTTVLVGGVESEVARSRYGATNLDLLLSGDVPPNPSELLSSSRMAQVLSELAEEYDLVIVDIAPVLSVADAALISPHVDLTLLVVDASRARKPQVLRSIRALEAGGAHVSGILLNKVKVAGRDVHYYGAVTPKERSALAKLSLRPRPTPSEANSSPVGDAAVDGAVVDGAEAIDAELTGDARADAAPTDAGAVGADAEPDALENSTPKYPRARGSVKRAGSEASEAVESVELAEERERESK